MKKGIIWVLVCLMLLALPVAAFGEGGGSSEEEDNEGQVIVIDDWTRDASMTELVVPGETEPFIPDAMEKVVVDKDGRVTVKNPRAFPYTAIAYLDCTAECGCSWAGTGFMVSHDRMLTASHCLVCSEHSKWAKKISFYFGYKNRKNYYYKYTGKWTAWAGNIFSDKQYSTNNDFGCIKIYDKTGDRTGWLGARWGVTDADIRNKYFYVAGYQENAALKYDYGMIRSTDDTHLYYDIDTAKGCSGGPIFDPDYYAIGINIAQHASTLDSYNIGYRLTDDIWTRLYELK